MNERLKQPSSLKRLGELLEINPATADGDVLGEIHNWCSYTFEMLLRRKIYMKKQQIKKSMALKLLKERFDQDEIEEIDRQALKLAEIEISNEDVSARSANTINIEDEDDCINDEEGDPLHALPTTPKEE